MQPRECVFGKCLAVYGRSVGFEESPGESPGGGASEQMVNEYDFYAAFTSPEEYRLEARSHTLGTLRVTMPITLGLPIVFAGRR